MPTLRARVVKAGFVTALRVMRRGAGGTPVAKRIYSLPPRSAVGRCCILEFEMLFQSSRIVADKGRNSGIYSLGPLGVVANDKERFPKRRSLFLYAAGI